MNTIKKFLLIITLIFISVFFINNKIALAAQIPLDRLSYECIYSDGSLFSVSWGASYDDGNGNMVNDISINRDAYNVKGSNSQQTVTAGGIYYVNPDDFRTGDKRHCSQFVLLGQVKEKEKDKNENPETYIKFTSNKNDKFEDSEISKGDRHYLWIFGPDGADQANKNKVVAELVSEQISIHDVDPIETLYFKRVTTNSNTPASYLIISKYDEFVVLSTGSRTTVIDYDFGMLKALEMGEKIYVNDPSPILVNNTSGNSYYSFYEVRFEVQPIKDAIHRFEYEKVEASDDIDISLGSGLCDDLLKNTSVPLRKIISITQLLVPALMVILCAIDISRMVFAGKLEDEIPKARKRIIIRLIIGATFFFVPLLVSLTVTMLQDSGGQNTELIQKIDCLFQ